MMLYPLSLDIDPLALGSPPLIDATLIKQHINVEDNDFDALIDTYTLSAIRWAENATHRTIFERPHRWTLKAFPWTADQSFRLPRGKAQSIAGIDYVNGGVQKTLLGPSSGSPAGADYQEDLSSDDGARLMPPRGGSWPSTDTDVPAPVTIRYTAGWPPAQVPQDVLTAILFAICDSFDIRGTPDLNAHGGRLDARMGLISPYQLMRWY